MLRVYHLIIGASLLLLIPLGARFVFPNLFLNRNTQPNPVVTPTKSATPSSTQPNQVNLQQQNIWQTRLNKNNIAPSDWQVAACEGNAPLLCVSSRGQRLGTVELGVYPINNNPGFQKRLTELGFPQGSQIDYQNSQIQSQLIKGLQAWVADSYNSLKKDHQAKYGTKIAFSTYPPQQVKVGKLPGLRYGFVRLKPDGAVQEQHISYVTYDGTNLYAITTSYGSGSSVAQFSNVSNLAVFQPYLSAIAENLNLP